MIDRPNFPMKMDRLSAFFRMFDVSVDPGCSDTFDADARLYVIADAQAEPRQLVLRPGRLTARRTAASAQERSALLAVSIGFGGSANPVVAALPKRIAIGFDNAPALRQLTAVFVDEARHARCGREAALGRLCEIMLLLILRHAIDEGATQPGLLAGLSHPALHRALVAMHDEPGHPWRIEELASVAGMSRSGFMASFRATVGSTPSAYLTRWRLAIARRALADGERVKAVAVRAGFGSASAFSRAFAREFGHAPTEAR